MRHRRSLFLEKFGLSLALSAMVCIWPAVARLQDGPRNSEAKAVDGNAVLSDRGLTKVGNLYLLQDEIDAKEEIKKGEDALLEIEAKADKLRLSIEESRERLEVSRQDLAAAQQQRDNLNLQKQRLNQQLVTIQDANSRAAIGTQVQQIDNLVRDQQDEVNRLNQTFVLNQSQLQKDSTKLRNLETDYESKKSSYERSFAHVKAKYQPLMRDPEVIKALKQLNRSAQPWVMIGPSWEYAKNAKSLAQKIMTDVGVEVTYTTVVKKSGRRSTKVKVPRATLAKQEKEVRAMGYQARLLEAKLNGPDGAANRKTMSEVVVRLKKGLADIQAVYAELRKDPLVTSAIEQVAAGATFEPTDDLKSYEKRLPALEKALYHKK